MSGQLSKTSSREEEKGQVSLAELNQLNHAEQPIDRMPASLKGLTESELADLEKKLVRKIDLVILPIIGIL